jgi:hypothetical protein
MISRCVAILWLISWDPGPSLFYMQNLNEAKSQSQYQGSQDCVRHQEGASLQTSKFFPGPTFHQEEFRSSNTRLGNVRIWTWGLGSAFRKRDPEPEPNRMVTTLHGADRWSFKLRPKEYRQNWNQKSEIDTGWTFQVFQWKNWWKMTIIFHTFFTENMNEKLGMFSPLLHF